MTEEAQNIAIAEACGKQHCPSCPDVGYYGVGDPYNGDFEQCEFCYTVEDSIFNAPNYTTDLNAMHEAEKVLGPMQFQDYFSNLAKPFSSDTSPHWHEIHSTAAQRAEAFLRTLNLWTQ